VLYRSDGPSPPKDEQRIRLPAGAGFSDFSRELERESAAMCAKVRRRILRSAGRVLAYGKDDDLLPALTRQLAEEVRSSSPRRTKCARRRSRSPSRPTSPNDHSGAPVPCLLNPAGAAIQVRGSARRKSDRSSNQRAVRMPSSVSFASGTNPKNSVSLSQP
jgi:hypothetical protein